MFRQHFRHAFRERCNKRAIALGCIFIYFGNQIINLPLDGTNVNLRIKQPCRPDYLLSNVCCSCKFVFGRSRADAHKLFYAFFKLFELQRTIVKSTWNTESVIDKFGLACKVSSVHCPYLRNCNMGLIDNCQEIIAHEIKQRKRRLPGFSPVKVS